jgi:hypothetical protein
MGSRTRALRRAVHQFHGEKNLRGSGARAFVDHSNLKSRRRAARRERKNRDGVRVGMVRSGHFVTDGFQIRAAEHNGTLKGAKAALRTLKAKSAGGKS